MDPSNYNLTKAAYSVNELQEILPIGRNKIYSAIKAKQLRVTKFGKRTMFLAPHIVDFLVDLQSGQSVA